MEYKLLEEQDLELMLDFVDDENTKYNVDVLKKFIDNKNDFGFIAKINNKIVGFALYLQLNDFLICSDETGCICGVF